MNVLETPEPALAARPDFSASTASLASLTGLRWIAAVAVFGYHIVSMRYFSPETKAAPELLFGAGSSGVALFFILSGFVLAWGSNPGDRPGRFWLKRVARIWPLHLVGVALALIVSVTFVPFIHNDDPLALVSNILLANSWHQEWWQAGNPVSWSLACEVFFYALFPLLIRLIRPLRKNGLLIVGLAMLSFLGLSPIIAELAHRSLSGYSWPPLRLPEFVIGIVLALLLRHGELRGPRLAPAMLLALVGYFLPAMLAPVGPSPINTTIISDIGLAALIAALARRDLEGRPTALARPGLVKLGQVSFAFYLVHLLVIQVAASAWPKHTPQLPVLPAIGLALVAFSCALITAFVLHQFVELRAQRFVMSLPARIASVLRRKPKQARGDRIDSARIRPTA